MWDFLFHSLAGWLGITGIIVVICGVVAWFFPPLRRIAIEVGAVVLAAAALYAQGSRDRAALEQRRKDEAVAKARKEYDQIDARPDTPADVADRLRKHGF